MPGFTIASRRISAGRATRSGWPAMVRNSVPSSAPQARSGRGLDVFVDPGEHARADRDHPVALALALAHHHHAALRVEIVAVEVNQLSAAQPVE